MSKLSRLLNKSRRQQGKRETRQYEHKKQPVKEPGRDGKNAMIEKYGHEAIASFRNNMAHPVEFFESSPRMLRDKYSDYTGPKASDHAYAAGDRRRRLARRYYDISMGAEITPLASVDFANEVWGGFGPRTPSDHKMDCIKLLNTIHAHMPNGVRRDMEECFYKGEFIFDVPNRNTMEIVLNRLRIGLDIMALEFSEISLADFESRWPGVTLSRTKVRKTTSSISG